MTTIKPINTETGEILEGRFGFIPTKKVNGFKDGWVAMSQNAMQVILQMKCAGEISGRDLDVLLYLTTILDFENSILVSHQNIADNLNMNRPNASRSMRNLTEKGCLLYTSPSPRDGLLSRMPSSA